MKHIVIYGQNYLEVVRLVEAINKPKKQIKIVGFLNDLKKFQGKVYLDLPVLGGQEKIPSLQKQYRNLYFFNNVNSTLKDRKQVSKILEDNHCQLISLIHPDVDQSRTQIGSGAIINAGCLVGVGAKIGNFLTTRLGSIISHDTCLGDYVYLSPGATICGYAKIGDGCYIGAGAIILPEIQVGAKTVIGAGAVVARDLPSNVIAIGVPAKIIKKRPGDAYRGRGM